MTEIKNIIFDLGGVIINLDINRTINAFNLMSPVSFESIYSQANQINLFNEFDKGKISDYEFFSKLREEIRFTGPDEDLLYAWNAMLLDVPEERLELLVDLKPDYRTFLLSNTCEPHIAAFESDLYRTHGVKNFCDYFDEVYYSCRVGMRKPDHEIFKMVISKNKLIPEETVYIDDSVQHVKAAGECGLKSYLLPKDLEVADLLKQLNLL